MAKKRTKIAVTYFVTIFVTVILICVIGLIVMKTLNSSGGISDVEVTAEDESTEYEPSMLDNQTTLFILDAGDRMTATAFLLTRLLPTEKKLVIIPLQSDMYADVSGEENTVYEFYRSGGVTSAKRAVESACDVSIDKYVKLGSSSFENLVAHFDTISYDFPYSLIYEDEQTGEQTIIRSGVTSLDPTTMRLVFTYPNYKNGETSRASIIGTIVSDFISDSQTTRLAAGTDQIFNAVINSGVDTDISEYDYEIKKDALEYMIENSDKLCDTVLPSGDYDNSGRYVLDPNFVKSIKSWFDLDFSSDDTSEETIDENGELPTMVTEGD